MNTLKEITSQEIIVIIITAFGHLDEEMLLISTVLLLLKVTCTNCNYEPFSTRLKTSYNRFEASVFQPPFISLGSQKETTGENNRVHFLEQ